jgi:hypothetical protein
VKNSREPAEERLGDEGTQERELGLETLPPRRKVHPSNKMQMVRLFYNSLIVLFLSLMAGLIVWGVRYLE